MAATKTVTYTADQTAELTAAYVLEPTEATVQEFAEKFGKSVRSIVAKLSREGVYKAKERTRKDGSAVQKKDETADAIGKILQLDEAAVESLTKANRNALQAIFNALANSRPL